MQPEVQSQLLFSLHPIFPDEEQLLIRGFLLDFLRPLHFGVKDAQYHREFFQDFKHRERILFSSQ